MALTDKKCPHCGKWNSGFALTCDCGYDFQANQPLPSGRGKQSKLGITSFIIGIVYILFLIASLGIPWLSTLRLFSSLSLVGLLLNLVGVGLGIAAVFQKNEKKMFGILGLAINGLRAIPQLALLVIFISGPPMPITF
jgi:hypothetical protein